MVLQNLIRGNNDLASIRSLLEKPHWTTEEYQVLKEFLRITREEQEEVLSKVDIEVLLAGLGHYFPDRPKNPQIRCFLHPDDTPSLTLYRINSKSKFPNTCYCFGCHRSLNPISVMVQLYGRNYPDTMDYLLGTCLGSPRQILRREIMARFKGHRNPDTKGKSEQLIAQFTPALSLPPAQYLVKAVGKERVKDETWQNQVKSSTPLEDPQVEAILEAAVTFYHLQLKNYQPGLDYLYGRGLSVQIIEEAWLGYSCGQGLAQWLKDRKLSLAVAREIGLLYHGTKEWLAGRIVLPSLPVKLAKSRMGRFDFLTGRLLPEQNEGAGSFNRASGLQTPSTSDKYFNSQPKYLSLKLPRPTVNRLEEFLTELSDSRYPPPNRFNLTAEVGESQPNSTLIRPYLVLVEGPFDSLLARQWGYQSICCYGTNLCYQALEKLKTAIKTCLLQKVFICFDADPSRALKNGAVEQGAGPKAAADLLNFLDTPKAQILSLPPGYKDIAILGEVKNGRAILAEAFEKAGFNLPTNSNLKGDDAMSTSKRQITPPESVDLVTALQIVTGELKQIAKLRYIERLDYHRIYEALETGQAALARAEALKKPESCSPDFSDLK